MTTELDSVAADAPDNAEAAKLRTARKAINAARGSGNITDEQHAEAIRKLLMNGTALAASPASQAERPREGWLSTILRDTDQSVLRARRTLVAGVQLFRERLEAIAARGKPLRPKDGCAACLLASDFYSCSRSASSQ